MRKKEKDLPEVRFGGRALSREGLLKFSAIYENYGFKILFSQLEIQFPAY